MRRDEGGLLWPLKVAIALAFLVGVTLFPWLCWYLLRHLWLARREQRVLLAKYGDLDMFTERLKEWNVLRKPPGEGT